MVLTRLHSKSSTQGSVCLFQLLVTVGIPWLVVFSVQTLPLGSHCLLLFYVSSLCLSQICLCLSLVRTFAIGFRAHEDSPGFILEVKLINVIMSGKTSFLNKEMFTNSRDLVQVSFGGPLFGLPQHNISKYFAWNLLFLLLYNFFVPSVYLKNQR